MKEASINKLENAYHINKLQVSQNCLPYWLLTNGLHIQFQLHHSYFSCHLLYCLLKCRLFTKNVRCTSSILCPGGIMSKDDHFGTLNSPWSLCPAVTASRCLNTGCQSLNVFYIKDSFIIFSTAHDSMLGNICFLESNNFPFHFNRKNGIIGNKCLPG